MKMIDNFAAIFPFSFPLEKAIHSSRTIRHQISIDPLLKRGTHCLCHALICCKTTNKQSLNAAILNHLLQVASHKSIESVTSCDRDIAFFEQSFHDLCFPGALGKYFPKS